MYDIGIDVGATFIKAALINSNLEKIAFKSVKTPKNSNDFYDAIKNIVNDLIIKEKIDLGKIDFIGMGIPGDIDISGYVHKLINIGLYEENILEKMQHIFKNTEIAIKNDAYVAMIAEKMYGSLKNTDNALLLTLGTGVGGSVLINGKIYTDKSGANPEIGHTYVGKNFYDCSCGQNGCLETFCSASAITKYYKKITGKSDQVSADLIFKLYENEEIYAVQTVERFIEYLAIGISNYCNIMMSEKIAIGGGLSLSFDLYCEKLRRKTRERLFNKELCDVRIVQTKFKYDAGVIGSALIKKYSLNTNNTD